MFTLTTVNQNFNRADQKIINHSATQY